MMIEGEKLGLVKHSGANPPCHSVFTEVGCAASFAFPAACIKGSFGLLVDDY